jgi:hypothetical protein
MNECIIKGEQFGIFRFFRVQKNWSKRITPHPPAEEKARLSNYVFFFWEFPHSSIC